MSREGKEVLVDFMLKRAMNKGTVFTSQSYKERWFLLTENSLTYYSGTLAVSYFFYLPFFMAKTLFFWEGGKASTFLLGKISVIFADFGKRALFQCQKKKRINLLNYGCHHIQ